MFHKTIMTANDTYGEIWYFKYFSIFQDLNNGSATEKEKVLGVEKNPDRVCVDYS